MNISKIKNKDRNEIINYRFKGQRDCYRLIRKTTNVKDVIKDLLQFPVFYKKKKRQDLFESFINSYLTCTKEFNELEELDELADKYDLYVSGSDQIWNKHSNELYSLDWKYLNPYMLTFTTKKKISYASSIGGTTDEEISEHMKKYLQTFNYVSAREESVARRLSAILKMNVECVLDPTLLLSAKEYIDGLSLDLHKDKYPYIFYYSLSGINTVRKHLKAIKRITKGKPYYIYVNTPYAYIPGNNKMKNIVDIGPIQFLNYILNAEYIITDSFHGTAFSINFEKPFYSICKPEGKSEYRKIELLSELGCTETLVFDVDKLKGLPNFVYTQDIRDRKQELIRKSKDELCFALKL